MVKKYYSKTILSVNIVLGNGKSRHISFSPQTEGGSVYYTDNEELQRGLEQHRLFGKGISVAEKDEAPQANESVAEEASLDESVKVVKVANLEEAKDYLSEKFDVSRTKMKGVSGVKAIGNRYGIEFEGI